MLKEYDAVIRKALAVLDALIVLAAFFIAFAMRSRFHEFYRIDLIPGPQLVGGSSGLSLSDYMIVPFFIVPIWCAALYFS